MALIYFWRKSFGRHSHFEMISTTDESPWSLDQIKEYFKNYSSSYDKGMNIETYPAPFIIASWVKQEFSQTNNVQVMDLGCGTGARYFK